MQRGSEKGVGDKETRRQGDKETRRFLFPLSPPLSRLPHSLLASFALFAFFAFFSPLFAQQSRKAEVIRLGQEFELKINQEAAIEGEGLSVVFESVLEDSRCPEGVDCIWSGNAKIRIRSSKQKHAPASIELNTHIEPKLSSYLDYEIKLVALKPRPKADKPVQSNEYKAALIITKK
jgi:hypothetical protein